MAKEYLEREAAIAAVNCTQVIVGDWIRNNIQKIPATDVAPVALCKDCKSCNTDIAVGGWYGMCAFWNGHSVMADDYCSRFRYKDSADMREDNYGNA